MHDSGYSVDGRVFRSVSNSPGGDVGNSTVFHYHQQGDLVWAEYAGGEVRMGHLLGRMMSDGRLDFRYHHVTVGGDVKLGMCVSTPTWAQGGRLSFLESWQWLSGDRSMGESVIEEVD